MIEKETHQVDKCFLQLSYNQNEFNKNIRSYFKSYQLKSFNNYTYYSIIFLRFILILLN